MACCSARRNEEPANKSYSTAAADRAYGRHDAWQPSDVDMAALISTKVSDGVWQHSMESLLADNKVVVTLLLRRYG